jgi:hypothetical protein
VLTQQCSTLQLSPMSKVTQPNTSYHVNISNATGHVECTCLGIECVDILLKDSYISLDEMPLWVQERLSLLMMLESKATLDSIGTKIDDYTFMIDGK